MKGPTAAYRLADAVVDGGIDAFVVSRRETGESWRRISIELLQRFEIDVSAETLRGWFKNRAASAA